MPAALAMIIGYALSSFALKLASTLAIGLMTYYGLYTLVEEAIDLIDPMISGLPADVLSILAIAGVPEALSVICSALLTRAAIKSAQVWVGSFS